MITMNPVVPHGRTVWDPSYFPIDENEERIRLVRAEMARRGLQCLVVFGHAKRYEDLCYLTHYIPVPSWSVAIVPALGSPILALGHGGGRDIPITRSRTWLADIRALSTLGAGLRTLVTELGIEGQVGLVGAEYSLPASLHDELLASLGEERCIPAGNLLSGLRRALRPREISAVRQAARIVEEAAAAFADSVKGGLSNAAAMVEADGAARKLGAHDFRGLVNLSDSGQLEPVEELTSFHSNPAVAYLAASFLGYWADVGITVGKGDAPALEAARRALRAMVNGTRAGVKAGDVAQQATDNLDLRYQEDALRCGLGNAVGLSLQQSPSLSPGSEELLVENSVLTLQVRVDGRNGPGALASDLVLVKATGCESLLHRSP